MSKFDVLLRKTVKFLLDIENARMAKMTAEEVVRLHGIGMDLLTAKPLEQCPDCGRHSVVVFQDNISRGTFQCCDYCNWPTHPFSWAPPEDVHAPVVAATQLAMGHVVEVVDGRKRVAFAALTEGERMETHHYEVDEAMGREYPARG